MEFSVLFGVVVGVIMCGLTLDVTGLPSSRPSETIVEGDIVLDKKLEKIRSRHDYIPEEEHDRLPDDSNPQRVKRNLYSKRRTHEHRWRHGLVPYEITHELSKNQQALDAIRAAIRQIEKYTCVRFTPRDKEKDYVVFTIDHGCFASIGRQGGKQKISVGVGCDYLSTQVHEILHTLGMYHEQTRYDRDLYVQVLWWNVQTGAENNFDIYPHGVIDSLKFPYDFMSATHYDNKDFSKNGQDTIQAIANPRKRLGNSRGMSKIDMRKILTAYKCYENKPLPKKAPCKDNFNQCHVYGQLCHKKWFRTGICKKFCGYCVD